MTSISVSAARPWDTPDSGSYIVGMTGSWIKPDFSSYDDQEQIEMCLQCPFADDCHDCVTVSNRKRRFSFLSARKRVRRD